MNGELVLTASACTSCMVCVEECPVWCLELEAHVEVDAHVRAGRRPVRRAVLDVFTVDYGLCMFCGICVEVCPFDALAWAAGPVPGVSGRQELRRDLTRPAVDAPSGSTLLG